MGEPDFYQCAIPFEKQRSDVRAEAGRTGAARIARAPGVKRLSDERADVFIIDDFLPAEQCALLNAAIDRGCVPSPLFNAEQFRGYRTSRTCNLDRGDAAVRLADLAIAGLLGLDPAHGEALQGQRYEPGQQFKRHADFFYIDQPYWAEVEPHGGQRTWTAMIYLDAPEAGGATVFPHLDIEVVPKVGRLLAWNNMDRDGSPNSWTIHEGCAVDAGIKHIVTKWYRERPWG